MDRTEELLLNHTLNWCSGYFRSAKKRRNDVLTTFGGKLTTITKIHHSMFVTDEYIKFIPWLKDARVLILKQNIPEDLAIQQHRLSTREITLESGWGYPENSPENIMGIFSHPDLIRAIPRHKTIVAALIPAAYLPNVSSWKLRTKERLDLMYAKDASFREFMKRQLTRTGLTSALTPENFRFLAGWVLIYLHTDEQGLTWRKALDPIPEVKSEVPVEENDLPWIMPEWSAVPPPLQSTFVKSVAANPLNTLGEMHPPTAVSGSTSTGGPTTIPHPEPMEDYKPTDDPWSSWG